MRNEWTEMLIFLQIYKSETYSINQNIFSKFKQNVEVLRTQFKIIVCFLPTQEIGRLHCTETFLSWIIWSTAFYPLWILLRNLKGLYISIYTRMGSYHTIYRKFVPSIGTKAVAKGRWNTPLQHYTCFAVAALVAIKLLDPEKVLIIPFRALYDGVPYYIRDCHTPMILPTCKCIKGRLLQGPIKVKQTWTRKQTFSVIPLMLWNPFLVEDWTLVALFPGSSKHSPCQVGFWFKLLNQQFQLHYACSRVCSLHLWTV